MININGISKQNGHQIVFIEASAAFHRGEKIGLVGPNGAGKSTLFRLITGREQPDEGQVSVERGRTIGYFSQDVGEMSGRSAVAEVMDGAGPVAAIAAELAALEAAMADPEQADDMEALIERYGEAQGRFEELGGYALDGRAREVLAGLSFSQEMMDGDVGKLSGGWKMRVALARILLMRPDAMLLDEPSNHLDIESLIWLEQFLKGYEGALVITSHDREFMNRIVNRIVEIDGGGLNTYTGNYDFYEQQRALAEKQQQAQFDRQQAMLAKELRFIERFKARASHAAQVQSRVKQIEKIERVEPPKRRRAVMFDFPASRTQYRNRTSSVVGWGLMMSANLRRQSTVLVRTVALAACAGWLAACGASLNNSQSVGDQKVAVGGAQIAAADGAAKASSATGTLTGKAEPGATAPATVQAVSTLTAAATPGNTGYLIGNQDVLEITVFKVPELTKAVQVADTGTINLPLLNEVAAAGRTTQQLERDLTTKLSAKYLQNPQVSVTVKEYNSQRVTLDGAVKKPGVYPVRGNLTLLQAISMAEGLDPSADSTVVVFRNVEGKRTAAKFDVADIRSGNIEDPGLRPGDLVVAPTSLMKESFNNLVKVLPLAGTFALVL